jgi:hypothetical protein
VNTMLVKRAFAKVALGAATAILPIAFFQANTAVVHADECKEWCCNYSQYCEWMYPGDAPWCRTANSLGLGVCCLDYSGYCCQQQTGSCLS